MPLCQPRRRFREFDVRVTAVIEFSLAWSGFPGRSAQGVEPFGPDLEGVSAEGDSDLVSDSPGEAPSFEQEAQFVRLQVENFGEISKIEAVRSSPDGYCAAGRCRRQPVAPVHRTPCFDGRELVELEAPALVESRVRSAGQGGVLAQARGMVPVMLRVVTIVSLPVATACADYAFTSRSGRSSLSRWDFAFEATTPQIAWRGRLQGRRHRPPFTPRAHRRPPKQLLADRGVAALGASMPG